MSIPLYDPSLKDKERRDVVSRQVTLILWFVYLWICKDLLRLLPEPFGSIVPGNPLMDQGATEDVLAYLLKLMGVAYFISVCFFVWRYLVEAYLRTRRVNERTFDQQVVGELFGLDAQNLKKLQSSKTIEVEVSRDGKIEIC